MSISFLFPFITIISLEIDGDKIKYNISSNDDFLILLQTQ